MSANSLQSLTAYSQFVAELLTRPTVVRSTVTVWSASPYSGIAEGEVWFKQDFRLRIREEIDFAEELITAYGYEVYQGADKLYWIVFQRQDSVLSIRICRKSLMRLRK